MKRITKRVDNIKNIALLILITIFLGFILTIHSKNIVFASSDDYDWGDDLFDDDDFVDRDYENRFGDDDDDDVDIDETSEKPEKISSIRHKWKIGDTSVYRNGFIVNNSSKVDFIVISDMMTYGKFNIKIKNSNGDLLFNKNINFGGESDDETYFLSLERDMYTVDIKPLKKTTKFDGNYYILIKVYATFNGDYEDFNEEELEEEDFANMAFPDEDFSISETSKQLQIGEKYKIKSAIPYAREAKWSSSNKRVATVNDSGKVSAKHLGKAIITVKCGGEVRKCNIRVSNGYANYLIDEYKGKTISLKTKVKNIPNYSKGIWNSSKPSVATVDSTGNVKLLKQGTANITLKADGKTYSIKVYVNDRYKLYLRALQIIRSKLKNPNSMTIESINYGSKSITILYRATNSFNAYVSGVFVGELKKGQLTYNMN